MWLFRNKRGDGVHAHTATEMTGECCSCFAPTLRLQSADAPAMNAFLHSSHNIVRRYDPSFICTVQLAG